MSDLQEENPREIFLASQEILSTIEWADALQDHNAAAGAIALFDAHIGVLLEAMLKIKARMFSRFLKDAVLTIARPIRALHRVREYVAAEPNTEITRRMQEDGRAFESFEQRVSDTVCTLVNNVSALWGGHKAFQLKLSPDPENELNNQHYLLVYLILLLLDRWVAPEDLEASSTYFECAHPKYKRFSSRGPNAIPEPKKDTRATLRHVNTMMDLCAKCHLSIENLLVWKPTPGMNENDDSYDEEALLEDNYPLSETGIVTLTSGLIYAMTNPAQLPNTYTLPQVFAPDWIFTTAGGLASGFLSSDENQLPLADKALLVLQYTIDRIPLNEFTMDVLDFCTKDSSTDRMGLFQIFQVMASFAATCSSANHRFYCFQALDRLIQACEDDVKMYLLEQLVSPKCPYESMRAAAINLVKGTIERAFVKLNRARAENAERIRAGSSGLHQIKSPFTSPLLLKTFGPSILKIDAQAFDQNPLKNERAWQDKYDLFMHALNFYLFLLMQDKQEDDLTEVWLSSNIQEAHDEFIEPLFERVQELKEDYIQRLAEVELTQDGAFGDDDEMDIPMHKIRDKNGVVDFDIDMESGDEGSGSDDDDSEKAKNGRPKDTAVDLNQKMMRLEIMDDLLERIQELTAPLMRGH